MSAHHNLDTIKAVAISNARKHKMNYNIIIMNPDGDGNFDQASGSTYEMVADSYFSKERPNVKLLYKTDDLLKS